MTSSIGKLVEYIWLDGAEPTQQLRSKARVVALGEQPSLNDFPEWNFDGSSTNQATGDNSDCLLKPVNFVKDPLRGNDSYLVICEVFNPDGTTHATNTRAHLRAVLDAGAADLDPWIGFEQEYTMFKNGRPLGWPKQGFPGPQGPYYCGIGNDEVFGRQLVEEHAAKCHEAGIVYYGLNAEVMPGQWEFQIGYRGIEGEDVGVLQIADHTWFARYLLKRLAESQNISISFSNKPMQGDWNGAGMHTNFSTIATRTETTGIKAIYDAMDKLQTKHLEHIAVYGYKLNERLTGLHETSPIDEFTFGDANRSCSVRIPKPVTLKGCGYFEDRRPGANADPYVVAAKLTATVCDIDEESLVVDTHCMAMVG